MNQKSEKGADWDLANLTKYVEDEAEYELR